MRCRARRWLVLAAVAALWMPLLAQRPPVEPLTVEAIFGSNAFRPRLVGEPEWSPDGKRLAYLEPGPTGPELWVLEVPGGQRRRVVTAERLRALGTPRRWPQWLQPTGPGRRGLPRYLWFPDGRSLLLIGADRLVRLELETGAEQVVATPGAIEDPKISPDGRRISFVRDYSIWTVAAGGGQPVRLTPPGSEELRQGQVDWLYPEELELFSAYWWSPDGRQVAFLQFDERSVERYPLVDPDAYDARIFWMRYPRAGGANPVVRLGVVGAAGGPVRWLATVADGGYLPRVEWLPGGRALAYERLDRAQKRLELWVADVGSGRSRRVLTEQADDWVNLGPEPVFLADGRRLLWTSERTGFRHLYLYDLDGRLLATLTGGAWQVEQIAGVDEAAGQVYFTATRESPAERQLYRVRLDGSGLERISQSGGTHAVEFAPGAKLYLDTWSAALVPPHQQVCAADGRVLVELADGHIAALEGRRLAPVEFLSVPGADGTPRAAALIRPPEMVPGRKYPAIVFVYGGPTAQNVLDAWGGNRLLWHELLAEHGFVVFWLDNRGAAGYGHRFEAALYHHFGSVEVDDQVAGARYLASLPYVDASRIGVWGWSYGGHMTLHLLLRAPEVFRAGVAVAPVTDWQQYDTAYTERYMGTPAENPDGYRAGSPVEYAARLERPLLLVHGTGDDNVHFGNTTEFVDRLIQAGRYARWVRLLALPGRGHPISDRAAQLELYRAMLAFFERELGGVSR